MEQAPLVGRQSAKEIFAIWKNKNKLTMLSKHKTKKSLSNKFFKECQFHLNTSVMMSPSINSNPLITPKLKIKP